MCRFRYSTRMRILSLRPWIFFRRFPALCCTLFPRALWCSGRPCHYLCKAFAPQGDQKTKRPEDLMTRRPKEQKTRGPQTTLPLPKKRRAPNLFQGAFPLFFCIFYPCPLVVWSPKPFYLSGFRASWRPETKGTRRQKGDKTHVFQ